MKNRYIVHYKIGNLEGTKAGFTMSFSIKELLLGAISLLLTLSNQSCDGLRILGLFPLQMRSHYVMCEELMIGLAEKGHQVDVYSPFPPKKPIPNFTHVSLEGMLPAYSNNMSIDKFVQSIPAKKKHWFEDEARLICNLMERPAFQRLLHDPPSDPPYDLVVHEICITYCYIPWGRRLNVPMIGVVTMPFLLDWLNEPLGTPSDLAVNPSINSPYVAPMSFFQRLYNVVDYHVRTYYATKYIRTQDESVEKFFGPGLPSTVELMKNLSLVLVNHDSAILGLRTFPPKVIPVGGLHIVDRNETLPKAVGKWLDESKDGCVYFSFGSMIRIETLPKRVLESFYESFRNISPVRVLWKVAQPEMLPPNLPSNVMTYPWFPQIQVLKHRNVKVFVTHGGSMGIQESVYCGVPMIGFPLFNDQFSNVENCVKRHMSIKLDVLTITEPIFTRALENILQDHTYEKAVKMISRKSKDRPMTLMDTAIFWIEYIHRHGNDALRSPLVDMPWWQTSLLDVYGFIGLILVSILFVGVKFARGLIRFLQEKMSNTHLNSTLKSKKD